MSQLLVSGMLRGEFAKFLEDNLARAKPPAVAVASAFVSVSGVQHMLEAFKNCGDPECHLIAGIDHAITHPEALSIAIDAGWSVRVGTSGFGIFHPKIIVAGSSFTTRGSLRSPTSFYVGSANMTEGGLVRNVECGLFSANPEDSKAAASGFYRMWRGARPITSELLTNYSASFAKANRARPYEVLTALGVDDRIGPAVPTADDLKTEPLPFRSAFRSEFAAEVWAELKSFTGDYTFQVEFPRSAGEVLQRLVGSATKANNRVDVECEDGQARQMTYRFYHDNSMYRLNVPNSVPGVSRARIQKSGIAIVGRGPEGGPPISLRIVPPCTEMDITIARSLSLGSWGRTRTRLFGWY